MGFTRLLLLIVVCISNYVFGDVTYTANYDMVDLDYASQVKTRVEPENNYVFDQLVTFTWSFPLESLTPIDFSPYNHDNIFFYVDSPSGFRVRVCFLTHGGVQPSLSHFASNPENYLFNPNIHSRTEYQPSHDNVVRERWFMPWNSDSVLLKQNQPHVRPKSTAYLDFTCEGTVKDTFEESSVVFGFTTDLSDNEHMLSATKPQLFRIPGQHALLWSPPVITHTGGSVAGHVGTYDFVFDFVAGRIHGTSMNILIPLADDIHVEMNSLRCVIKPPLPDEFAHLREITSSYILDGDCGEEECNRDSVNGARVLFLSINEGTAEQTPEHVIIRIACGAVSGNLKLKKNYNSLIAITLNEGLYPMHALTMPVMTGNIGLPGSKKATLSMLSPQLMEVHLHPIGFTPNPDMPIALRLDQRGMPNLILASECALTSSTNPAINGNTVQCDVKQDVDTTAFYIDITGWPMLMTAGDEIRITIEVDASGGNLGTFFNDWSFSYHAVTLIDDMTRPLLLYSGYLFDIQGKEEMLTPVVVTTADVQGDTRRVRWTFTIADTLADGNKHFITVIFPSDISESQLSAALTACDIPPLITVFNSFVLPRGKLSALGNRYTQGNIMDSAFVGITFDYTSGPSLIACTFPDPSDFASFPENTNYIFPVTQFHAADDEPQQASSWYFEPLSLAKPATIGPAYRSLSAAYTLSNPDTTIATAELKFTITNAVTSGKVDPTRSLDSLRVEMAYIEYTFTASNNGDNKDMGQHHGMPFASTFKCMQKVLNQYGDDAYSRMRSELTFSTLTTASPVISIKLYPFLDKIPYRDAENVHEFAFYCAVPQWFHTFAQSNVVMFGKNGNEILSFPVEIIPVPDIPTHSLPRRLEVSSVPSLGSSVDFTLPFMELMQNPNDLFRIYFGDADLSNNPASCVVVDTINQNVPEGGVHHYTIYTNGIASPLYDVFFEQYYVQVKPQIYLMASLRCQLHIPANGITYTEGTLPLRRGYRHAHIAVTVTTMHTEKQKYEPSLINESASFAIDHVRERALGVPSHVDAAVMRRQDWMSTLPADVDAYTFYDASAEITTIQDTEYGLSVRIGQLGISLSGNLDVQFVFPDLTPLYATSDITGGELSLSAVLTAVSAVTKCTVTFTSPYDGSTSFMTTFQKITRRENTKMSLLQDVFPIHHMFVSLELPSYLTISGDNMMEITCTSPLIHPVVELGVSNIYIHISKAIEKTYGDANGQELVDFTYIPLGSTWANYGTGFASGIPLFSQTIPSITDARIMLRRLPHSDSFINVAMPDLGSSHLFGANDDYWRYSFTIPDVRNEDFLILTFPEHMYKYFEYFNNQVYNSMLPFIRIYYGSEILPLQINQRLLRNILNIDVEARRFHAGCKIDYPNVTDMTEYIHIEIHREKAFLGDVDVQPSYKELFDIKLVRTNPDFTPDATIFSQLMPFSVVAQTLSSEMIIPESQGLVISSALCSHHPICMTYDSDSIYGLFASSLAIDITPLLESTMYTTPGAIEKTAMKTFEIHIDFSQYKSFLHVMFPTTTALESSGDIEQAKFFLQMDGILTITGTVSDSFSSANTASLFLSGILTPPFPMSSPFATYLTPSTATMTAEVKLVDYRQRIRTLTGNLVHVSLPATPSTVSEFSHPPASAPMAITYNENTKDLTISFSPLRNGFTVYIDFARVQLYTSISGTTCTGGNNEHIVFPTTQAILTLSITTGSEDEKAVMLTCKEITRQETQVIASASAAPEVWVQTAESNKFFRFFPPSYTATYNRDSLLAGGTTTGTSQWSDEEVSGLHGKLTLTLQQPISPLDVQVNDLIFIETVVAPSACNDVSNTVHIEVLMTPTNLSGDIPATIGSVTCGELVSNPSSFLWHTRTPLRITTTVPSPVSIQTITITITGLAGSYSYLPPGYPDEIPYNPFTGVAPVEVVIMPQDYSSTLRFYRGTYTVPPTSLTMRVHPSRVTDTLPAVLRMGFTALRGHDATAVAFTVVLDDNVNNLLLTDQLQCRVYHYNSKQVTSNTAPTLTFTATPTPSGAHASSFSNAAYIYVIPMFFGTITITDVTIECDFPAYSLKQSLYTPRLTVYSATITHVPQYDLDTRQIQYTILTPTSTLASGLWAVGKPSIDPFPSTTLNLPYESLLSEVAFTGTSPYQQMFKATLRLPHLYHLHGASPSLHDSYMVLSRNTEYYIELPPAVNYSIPITCEYSSADPIPVHISTLLQRYGSITQIAVDGGVKYAFVISIPSSITTQGTGNFPFTAGVPFTSEYNYNEPSVFEDGGFPLPTSMPTSTDVLYYFRGHLSMECRFQGHMMYSDPSSQRLRVGVRVNHCDDKDESNLHISTTADYGRSILKDQRYLSVCATRRLRDIYTTIDIASPEVAMLEYTTPMEVLFTSEEDSARIHLTLALNDPNVLLHEHMIATVQFPQNMCSFVHNYGLETEMDLPDLWPTLGKRYIPQSLEAYITTLGEQLNAYSIQRPMLTEIYSEQSGTLGTVSAKSFTFPLLSSDNEDFLERSRIFTSFQKGTSNIHIFAEMSCMLDQFSADTIPFSLRLVDGSYGAFTTTASATVNAPQLNTYSSHFATPSTRTFGPSNPQHITTHCFPDPVADVYASHSFGQSDSNNIELSWSFLAKYRGVPWLTGDTIQIRTYYALQNVQWEIVYGELTIPISVSISETYSKYWWMRYTIYSLKIESSGNDPWSSAISGTENIPVTLYLRASMPDVELPPLSLDIKLLDASLIPKTAENTLFSLPRIYGSHNTQPTLMYANGEYILDFGMSLGAITTQTSFQIVFTPEDENNSLRTILSKLTTATFTPIDPANAHTNLRFDPSITIFPAFACVISAQVDPTTPMTRFAFTATSEAPLFRISKSIPMVIIPYSPFTKDIGSTLRYTTTLHVDLTPDESAIEFPILSTYTRNHLTVALPSLPPVFSTSTLRITFKFPSDLYTVLVNLSPEVKFTRTIKGVPSTDIQAIPNGAETSFAVVAPITPFATDDTITFQADLSLATLPYSIPVTVPITVTTTDADDNRISTRHNLLYTGYTAPQGGFAVKLTSVTQPSYTTAPYTMVITLPISEVGLYKLYFSMALHNSVSSCVMIDGNISPMLVEASTVPYGHLFAGAVIQATLEVTSTVTEVRLQCSSGSPLTPMRIIGDIHHSTMALTTPSGTSHITYVEHNHGCQPTCAPANVRAPLLTSPLASTSVEVTNHPTADKHRFVIPYTTYVSTTDSTTILPPLLARDLYLRVSLPRAWYSTSAPITCRVLPSFTSAAAGFTLNDKIDAYSGVAHMNATLTTEGDLVALVKLLPATSITGYVECLLPMSSPEFYTAITDNSQNSVKLQYIYYRDANVGAPIHIQLTAPLQLTLSPFTTVTVPTVSFALSRPYPRAQGSLSVRISPFRYLLTYANALAIEASGDISTTFPICRIKSDDTTAPAAAMAALMAATAEWVNFTYSGNIDGRLGYPSTAILFSLANFKPTVIYNAFSEKETLKLPAYNAADAYIYNAFTGGIAAGGDGDADSADGVGMSVNNVSDNIITNLPPLTTTATNAAKAAAALGAKVEEADNVVAAASSLISHLNNSTHTPAVAALLDAMKQGTYTELQTTLIRYLFDTTIEVQCQVQMPTFVPVKKPLTMSNGAIVRFNTYESIPSVTFTVAQRHLASSSLLASYTFPIIPAPIGLDTSDNYLYTSTSPPIADGVSPHVLSPDNARMVYNDFESLEVPSGTIGYRFAPLNIRIEQADIIEVEIPPKTLIGTGVDIPTAITNTRMSLYCEYSLEQWNNDGVLANVTNMINTDVITFEYTTEPNNLPPLTITSFFFNGIEASYEDTLYITCTSTLLGVPPTITNQGRINGIGVNMHVYTTSALYATQLYLPRVSPSDIRYYCPRIATTATSNYGNTNEGGDILGMPIFVYTLTNAANAIDNIAWLGPLSASELHISPPVITYTHINTAVNGVPVTFEFMGRDRGYLLKQEDILRLKIPAIYYSASTTCTMAHMGNVLTTQVAYDAASEFLYITPVFPPEGTSNPWYSPISPDDTSIYTIRCVFNINPNTVSPPYALSLSVVHLNSAYNPSTPDLAPMYLYSASPSPIFFIPAVLGSLAAPVEVSVVHPYQYLPEELTTRRNSLTVIIPNRGVSTLDYSFTLPYIVEEVDGLAACTATQANAANAASIVSGGVTVSITTIPTGYTTLNVRLNGIINTNVNVNVTCPSKYTVTTPLDIPTPIDMLIQPTNTLSSSSGTASPFTLAYAIAMPVRSRATVGHAYALATYAHTTKRFKLSVFPIALAQYQSHYSGLSLKIVFPETISEAASTTCTVSLQPDPNISYSIVVNNFVASITSSSGTSQLFFSDIIKSYQHTPNAILSVDCAAENAVFLVNSVKKNHITVEIRYLVTATVTYVSSVTADYMLEWGPVASPVNSNTAINIDTSNGNSLQLISNTPISTVTTNSILNVWVPFTMSSTITCTATLNADNALDILEIVPLEKRLPEKFLPYRHNFPRHEYTVLSLKHTGSSLTHTPASPLLLRVNCELDVLPVYVGVHAPFLITGINAETNTVQTTMHTSEISVAKIPSTVDRSEIDAPAIPLLIAYRDIYNYYTDLSFASPISISNMALVLPLPRLISPRIRDQTLHRGTTVTAMLDGGGSFDMQESPSAYLFSDTNTDIHHLIVPLDEFNGKVITSFVFTFPVHVLDPVSAVDKLPTMSATPKLAIFDRYYGENRQTGFFDDLLSVYVITAPPTTPKLIELKTPIVNPNTATLRHINIARPFYREDTNVLFSFTLPDTADGIVIKSNTEVELSLMDQDMFAKHTFPLQYTIYETPTDMTSDNTDYNSYRLHYDTDLHGVPTTITPTEDDFNSILYRYRMRVLLGSSFSTILSTRALTMGFSQRISMPTDAYQTKTSTRYHSFSSAASAGPYAAVPSTAVPYSTSIAFPQFTFPLAPSLLTIADGAVTAHTPTPWPNHVGARLDISPTFADSGVWQLQQRLMRAPLGYVHTPYTNEFAKGVTTLTFSRYNVHQVGVGTADITANVSPMNVRLLRGDIISFSVPLGAFTITTTTTETSPSPAAIANAVAAAATAITCQYTTPLRNTDGEQLLSREVVAAPSIADVATATITGTTLSITMSRIRVRFLQEYSRYDESMILTCSSPYLRVPISSEHTRINNDSYYVRMDVIDSNGVLIASTHDNGITIDGVVETEGLRVTPLSFVEEELPLASMVDSLRPQFGPLYSEDIDVYTIIPNTVDTSAISHPLTTGAYAISPLSIGNITSGIIAYKFRGYNRGTYIDTNAGEQLHIRIPVSLAYLPMQTTTNTPICWLYHEGIETLTTSTLLRTEQYLHVMLTPSNADSVAIWSRAVRANDASVYEVRCQYSVAPNNANSYPSMPIRMAIRKHNPDFKIAEPFNPAIPPYLWISAPSSTFSSPPITSMRKAPHLYFHAISTGALSLLSFDMTASVPAYTDAITMRMWVRGNGTVSMFNNADVRCYDALHPTLTVTYHTNAENDMVITANLMSSSSAQRLYPMAIRCENVKAPLTLTGTTHHHRILMQMSRGDVPYPQHDLIDALAITTAPATIYSGSTASLYGYSRTSTQLTLDIEPIGMALTAANAPSITFSLPTVYPFFAGRANENAGISFVVSTAPTCTATTFITVTEEIFINEDAAATTNAYLITTPIIPSTSTATIAATACVRVVVYNVKMMPLGVYTQTLQPYLERETIIQPLAINFPIPAQSLSRLPLPLSRLRYLSTAPTNSVPDSGAADNIVTYTSGGTSTVTAHTRTMATYSFNINTPINIPVGSYIIIQHFADALTTCSIPSIPWTLVHTHTTNTRIPADARFSVRDRQYLPSLVQFVYTIDAAENTSSFTLSNIVTITCQQALTPPIRLDVSTANNRPVTSIKIVNSNTRIAEYLVDIGAITPLNPVTSGLRVDASTSSLRVFTTTIPYMSSFYGIRLTVPISMSLAPHVPHIDNVLSSAHKWAHTPMYSLCYVNSIPLLHIARTDGANAQQEVYYFDLSHITPPTPIDSTLALDIICSFNARAALNQPVSAELVYFREDIFRKNNIFSQSAVSVDPVTRVALLNMDTMSVIHTPLSTNLPSIEMRIDVKSCYSLRPYVRQHRRSGCIIGRPSDIPDKFTFPTNGVAMEWSSLLSSNSNPISMQQSLIFDERNAPLLQYLINAGTTRSIDYDSDTVYNGKYEYFFQMSRLNMMSSPLAQKLSFAYSNTLDMSSTSIGTLAPTEQLHTSIFSFLALHDNNSQSLIFELLVQHLPVLSAAPLGLSLASKHKFTASVTTLDPLNLNAAVTYTNFWDWLSTNVHYTVSIPYVNVPLQNGDSIVVTLAEGSLLGKLQSPTGTVSEITTKIMQALTTQTYCNLTISHRGYESADVITSTFPYIYVSKLTVNTTSPFYSTSLADGVVLPISSFELTLPPNTKTSANPATGSVFVPSSPLSYYEDSMSITCTSPMMTIPSQEYEKDLKDGLIYVNVDVYGAATLTKSRTLVATTRLPHAQYGVNSKPGHGIPLIIDDLPSSEVYIKRVHANGYVQYGDDEVVTEGDGSIYIQTDLPVLPSATLPAGTRVEVTLPSERMEQDGYYRYAFMDMSANSVMTAPIQCYYGASYTNPHRDLSNTTITMKNRYYAYAAGNGTLEGNGSLYTTMSANINSTATVTITSNRPSTTYTIIFNNDWTIPDFLATPRMDGSVMMSPVMEILCVHVRYPNNVIAKANNIPIKAYTPNLISYFSSTEAAFSGVPLKLRPGVGELQYGFTLASTEAYYVGNLTFSVEGYQLDIDADTYIDVLLPDSHPFEFKHPAPEGYVYAPTEAYYAPTTCTVNGVKVADLVLPRYSPVAAPQLKISGMVASEVEAVEEVNASAAAAHVASRQPSSRNMQSSALRPRSQAFHTPAPYEDMQWLEAQRFDEAQWLEEAQRLGETQWLGEALWAKDVFVRDRNYDWIVRDDSKHATPTTAFMPTAEEDPTPTPAPSDTYDLDLRVSMRIPTAIKKQAFLNQDLKSMNLTITCTSVRNPAVTSPATPTPPTPTPAGNAEATVAGNMKFVLYDWKYKQLITAAGKDSFSGYSEGLTAAIVPTTTISLPAITQHTWGYTQMSIQAANNTAGSDFSTLTLSATPMNIDLTSRAVIDFRLPSSWLVQSIPLSHPRSPTVCVASVDEGSSVDAQITGITVMDGATKRITFYPQHHIRSSMPRTHDSSLGAVDGTFRLFCEGVRVPLTAKVATTTTVRAYDVIVPFNWVPGHASSTPTLTQADYNFGTRALMLSNDEVAIPRITRTLAPRTLLSHTVQLETLKLLSQAQMEKVVDMYVSVFTTAIRTGNVRPQGVVDAYAEEEDMNGGGMYVYANTDTTGTDIAAGHSANDTSMTSSASLAPLALPRSSIMYKISMYSNTLDYRKVYIDDFGNFEYDITLLVTVLIEGVGGTDAYQLRNLLLANSNLLTNSAQKVTEKFVIRNNDPVVLSVPGSCLANTYSNDGNMADVNCGRGCARCPAQAGCFDHSDCLSGKCSSGISANSTFNPIFDEDDFAPRTTPRGFCIDENAEKVVDGGNGAGMVFMSMWCLLVAVVAMLVM